jgi:hypothetical protein
MAPVSQVVTALGGPIMNLALCGLLMPSVLASGQLADALNPLVLPLAPEQFAQLHPLRDAQLLMFWINWALLVVNLAPVFPFDGGQVVRSWLMTRLGGQMATELSIRIAFVAGIVLAALAMFVFKHVVLLGLAFLIVLLAMQESFQVQAGDAFEDSFMGYDFSQGYTSLEKSEHSKSEQQSGILTRWMESRRIERQRRVDQQQQEVDQQLDAILAKVHEHGLSALTPAERRLLKRASDRFRSKGKDQS